MDREETAMTELSEALLRLNEYFEYDFAFKFTGSYNQNKQMQLKNFILELNHYSNKEHSVPKDWTDAFSILRDYLEAKDPNKKQVVFFDEMPWMDNQKSGFLPAFEWFWNAWAGARKNLIFIACGSAASWITDKIEKNKGGLYNRATCKLHLQPLNLHDVEIYLRSRNIEWSRYDITLCYMIMGGIPYYLRLLDRERTLNENIDELFFRNGAELSDEFEQLYRTGLNIFSGYLHTINCMVQYSHRRHPQYVDEIDYGKETGQGSKGDQIRDYGSARGCGR